MGQHGDAVTEGGGGHSAMCLRLMRVFPRVVRGMRRYQDQTTPQAQASLGPRHVAALEQLRDGPLSVGVLAAGLGLTLSTVSGVIAGLDRAGFVERSADQADRRRTIVEIAPAARPDVERWLDGAAAPLARVLDRLAPSERAAFLKAMDLLEAEFQAAAAAAPPVTKAMDLLKADFCAADPGTPQSLPPDHDHDRFVAHSAPERS